MVRGHEPKGRRLYGAVGGWCNVLQLGLRDASIRLPRAVGFGRASLRRARRAAGWVVVSDHFWMYLGTIDPIVIRAPYY